MTKKRSPPLPPGGFQKSKFFFLPPRNLRERGPPRERKMEKTSDPGSLGVLLKPPPLSFFPSIPPGAGFPFSKCFYIIPSNLFPPSSLTNSHNSCLHTGKKAGPAVCPPSTPSLVYQPSSFHVRTQETSPSLSLSLTPLHAYNERELLQYTSLPPCTGPTPHTFCFPSRELTRNFPDSWFTPGGSGPWDIRGSARVRKEEGLEA